MEPVGFIRSRQVAYQPFQMVDDAGHVLKPTDKMELSNGKVVTAEEFYASLNRIEQGLNKVGHSLRDTGNLRRIEGNYANDRVFQTQFADYRAQFRSVGQMSLPNRKAILHARQSPAAAISRQGAGTTLMSRQSAPTSTISRQGAAASKFGTVQVNELNGVINKGTTLGKDATTVNSWGMDKSFGDSNLGVRLRAGLSMNAASTNSADPPTLSASTTTIKATFNGSCQGTLLGNRFDILNASCEIGTSSQANDVTLGWSVNVAGYQILTGSKSYGAVLQWSDGYSIPFQKQSQTMEYPIFGPFACSGFVGIEGEAGIKANIALRPIYAEADIVPYVKAGVFGEVDAGLDAEVASAWGGIHADLTLVDDQFTLGANLGIVALPGNKVGWADEAYARNTFNMFTGTLSLVAHIFGPGGVKIQDWEYPFYTIRGYHDDSTLFHTGSVHVLSWGGN